MTTRLWLTMLPVFRLLPKFHPIFDWTAARD